MGMAAVEAQFHVLAVDDSLIDRKLIERLLKTSSYQVTTVDSGSKALEVLGWHEDEAFDSPKIHQELEVNLVITDYCMPGMTGYDLLKKIKESSLLRDIPVVIMSSENVPSRINRCLEEGAEEFFLKPVRLSDVNKLKPHMMKAKSKDIQKPEKPENDDSAEDENDDSAEEEEEEKQENDDSAEEEEEENDDSAGEEEEETEQQIVQSNNNNNNNNNINNNNNNNKRKSIDDGLSPDRSRPNRTRYSNGLTVMSN